MRANGASARSRQNTAHQFIDIIMLKDRLVKHTGQINDVT